MSDAHPRFDRATHDAVDLFRPLIAVIVQIAHGDESRRAEIELLLPQLDNNGWQIGPATRRIWAGERDGVALTQALDANSAAVVRAIIDAVETTQTDDEAAHITAVFARWRPIILTVAAACLDIAQARTDIEGFLPQLETQAEWQQLAQRLRLLLAGDRNPQRLLADLDPHDMIIVSSVLQALDQPDNLVTLLRQERDRAAAEDHQQ